MRRLLIALVLIWSIVLTAMPVAAGTLDQQQTQDYGSYSLNTQSFMTFTAGVGGGLDQVDLLMRCISENCSGQITVQIRAVCDGLPTETVLTGAVVDLAQWNDSVYAPTWKPVRFGTPVRVRAGDTYGIYVNAPGVYSGYGMQIAGDPYPAGEFFSRPRPPYPWTLKSAGTDMAFKTYVAPPSPADLIPSGAGCGPSDAASPVTTASLSAQPNEAGWHNRPVAVTFQAADNAGGTGVKQITYNVGVGAVTVPGAYAQVAVEAQGTTTISYRAVDNAGNAEAAKSLTLKIDREAPVVTVTGGGTYDVDQTVEVTCTASDSLSGVAGHDCLDSALPAYLLGPGSRTVKYTAVDYAGNEGSGRADINVVVTPEGLAGLTKQFVTKAGVAGGLITKLKAGAVNAYIHELEAQSGKALTAERAETLIGLAAGIQTDR